MKLPTHPLFKNLTGRRFSRLIVVGYDGRIGKSHAFLCLCDCGATITTRGYCLTTNVTKSCGCLKLDATRKSRTTHGLYGCEIWGIYCGIKNRCLNSNVKSYPRYGGAGVKICKRWLVGEDGKSGIECFLKDMGPRPSPAHSVDRFPDPFGNYEPSNCRWATDSQQARNTRKTKLIAFRGRRLNPHDWASTVGIPAEQILKRLGRGWSVKRALTQPMRSWP